MQYAMLLAADVLLALVFSLNKVYQRLKGTAARAVFGFNSLLGLFTAIIFFVINGCKTDFSLYSLLIAAAVNTLTICYNFVGFRLLKTGTMAMYTLFLLVGGMTIPYIFGLLFLNEPFSLLRTAALVLIITGIAVTNIGSSKVNLRQIGMCAAVFLLNGFVSVFSKLHQTDFGFYTVDAKTFVMIGGAFKFVFAGMLYLFVRKQNKEKAGKIWESEKSEKSERKGISVLPLLIITAVAAAEGLSYLIQLQGALALPATVLYPFVTGGSIVASSLAGVIFFKEKLSKKLILSIALCVIGTIMFI